MDSPNGETAQTEITLQTSQDPEHGFLLKGRPLRQTTLFKKIRILNMYSPKGVGVGRRQKDLFTKVWILSMDSLKGEAPQTDNSLQKDQNSEKCSIKYGT